MNAPFHSLWYWLAIFRENPSALASVFRTEPISLAIGSLEESSCSFRRSGAIRGRSIRRRLLARRTQGYGIGGDAIEVVRVGRGEPIVVIPGLAGGWKLAWPLIRSLSRYFEVISFGLRGDEGAWDELGASTARARGIGEYAQDVVCLIDQLGLDGPAVFGLSFGGAIALELATEYPDRLGALMLHGVEARFRPSIGSRIARRVLERFPLPSDSRFINQFFHLLFGNKPESGPLLDFVTSRIWETGQPVMAERLAALESFDISDRLWSIAAPRSWLPAAAT